MAVKVTFDIANKLIIVNSGITEIDVRIDLYSDAKEDWESGALDIDSVRLNKVRFPFRVIGGDDTAPGEIAPLYAYLTGGWRIRPQEANHILSMTGGAILVNGDTTLDPFVDTVGAFNVRVRLYVPVQGTILESGVSGLTSAESALLNDISYTEKFIYINTELGVNGDGKSSSPFNNISDAVDFAELKGWPYLVALSDLTLIKALKNFTVFGIGLPTIDFKGQNVDKSVFKQVGLTGEQVGTITAEQVSLLPGLTGLDGYYLTAGLAGNVAMANNAHVTIASMSAIFSTAPSPFEIDMGVDNTHGSLNVRKASGAIAVKNVNSATKYATFEFSGGRFVADNTNTLGLVGVAGLPDSAVDVSNATCTVIVDGLLPSADTNAETILNKVSS